MAVEVRHVPAPSQVRAGVKVVPTHVEAPQVVPLAYSRQPPDPSQEPSVPQLAAPSSVHWFKGSCPAGTALQVPTLPVRAQDWQVPAQAVTQQKPWAQNPELHSAAAAQAAPIGFLPQLPEMQVLGATQSALEAHVVLQAPVPQTNGSHEAGVAATQAPMPLQVRAGVNVVPVQAAPAHTVPAPYRRQPPDPSQVPSVPQLAAPLSVHWPSGSWPTGTRVQLPALPDSAQERQVPVQLELQQTPCWQRPESHSAAVVQTVPSGFFEQTPPLQTLGDTQSLLPPQLVRQVPAMPQV